MITSALVSKIRRKVQDIPHYTKAVQGGDGSSTVFALPRAPIVESSYLVYLNTSAKSEPTHYSLDKDSGELTFVTAPGNGVAVKAFYKYANFRDQNFVEAINYGIDFLNAKGFYRQTVRDATSMRLSANVQSYSAPSGCKDIYEVLLSDNGTTSGNFSSLPANWEYQEEANRLTVGFKPSIAGRLQISYLRKINSYNATSATLDVPDDWLEIVSKKAEEYFYDHMSVKVATQGAATVDEGHFSFTNLRQLARDAERTAENLAKEHKPTRPAKDVKWVIAGAKA